MDLYRFIVSFIYEGNQITEVTDWFNFEEPPFQIAQVYISDKPSGYLVIEDIDCARVRMYDLNQIDPDSFSVKLERNS